MLTKLTGEHRLLAALGTALFALAAHSASPEEAKADPNPYYPWCYGYPECNSCNGSTNTDTANWYYPGYSLGCYSGGQCWYSVDSASCRTYHCCDYENRFNGARCICTAVYPTCP